MIGEQRRRAYLRAMQVDSWLPAQVLPFAAASRPSLLRIAKLPEGQSVVAAEPALTAPVSEARSSSAPLAVAEVRAGLQMPATPAPEKPISADEEVAATVTVAPAKVPRFSLQLYRAGNCLLLVELSTGEAFQSRDPAYVLFKDLLRAAGLPDSPQLLGEPVKWPLLAKGNLNQGPAAARDFLRGFLAQQIEDGAGCTCLWLVGLPALRYVAEVEADMYNCELQIDELGLAWAVPGLELLMDEPQRKASLWLAMRRLMPRWNSADA